MALDDLGDGGLRGGCVGQVDELVVDAVGGLGEVQRDGRPSGGRHRVGDRGAEAGRGTGDEHGAEDRAAGARAVGLGVRAGLLGPRADVGGRCRGVS